MIQLKVEGTQMCNRMGHNNNLISAVCMRRGCDQPLPCCLICMMQEHKNHDYVDITVIRNQINLSLNFFNQLSQLSESICEVCQSWRQQIQKIIGQVKVSLQLSEYPTLNELSNSVKYFRESLSQLNQEELIQAYTKQQDSLKMNLEQLNRHFNYLLEYQQREIIQQNDVKEKIVIQKSYLSQNRDIQKNDLKLKNVKFVLTQQLFGFKKQVEAVAISSDDKYLAFSESDSSKIILWDVKSNSIITQYSGYTKEVSALQFSNYNYMLVVCSRFYNLTKIFQSKSKYNEFLHHNQLFNQYCMQMSNILKLETVFTFPPMNRYQNIYSQYIPCRQANALITQTRNHQLIDLNGAYKLLTYAYFTLNPFSANRVLIVLENYETKTQGPYLPTNSEKQNYFRKTMLEGHQDIINRIAFTDDSKYLISVSSDMSLRVWDLNIKKEINKKKCNESLHGVAYSSQQLLIACSDYNGCAYLFDSRTLNNLSLKVKFQAHKECCYCIEFIKNSTVLMTTNDSETRFWQVDDVLNQNSIHFKEIKDGGWTIKAYPIDNPQFIINSDSYKKYVKLWNYDSTELIQSIEIPGGLYVNSFAVTSDFQQIISGGQNKRVNIFEKI